jgi:hypothetical protein
LILLVLNGFVSSGFTSFIRSVGLAIAASAITTVMRFLVWGDKYGGEFKCGAVHDVFLAVNIILIFVVPAVIGTSVGFVLLTRRAQQNSGAVKRKPESITRPEAGKSHQTKDRAE